MLSVQHKAALDAARGRGVRGSGRGARRPAPFMAGHNYLIAADTITAHRAFCHTFVELTMSRLPKEFALLAVPGGNREAERRGFIALGRLEDYSARVVFRHEQTLAKPKADRLDLLRATRAHFGQIFMLYSDPAQEIEGLLSSENSSDIETRD